MPITFLSWKQLVVRRRVTVPELLLWLPDGSCKMNTWFGGGTNVSYSNGLTCLPSPIARPAFRGGLLQQLQWFGITRRMSQAFIQWWRPKSGGVQRRSLNVCKFENEKKIPTIANPIEIAGIIMHFNAVKLMTTTIRM